MSVESSVKANEEALNSTREWTKYFWQVMIDFAILTMASSLVFCSVMLDPFGLARAKEDTCPQSTGNAE